MLVPIETRRDAAELERRGRFGAFRFPICEQFILAATEQAEERSTTAAVADEMPERGECRDAK